MGRLYVFQRASRSASRRRLPQPQQRTFSDPLAIIPRLMEFRDRASWRTPPRARLSHEEPGTAVPTGRLAMATRREFVQVFLVLKEFEPTFSRGGDMPQNFLAPATRVKELEDAGESAMKSRLSRPAPHCHRRLRWLRLAGPQRRDCLAGHVRFELRNVGANYPFERSHGFPGIKPDSGHRDCSRLSCSAGDKQLGAGF